MIANTRVCPKCGWETQVNNSRYDELQGMIKRERVCLNCKHRFKTLEIDCKTFDSLFECKTLIDRLGELVNAKHN